MAIHPAGRRTGTPAMVAPSGTAIPARPGRSIPNTAAEAKDKERRLRLNSVQSTTVGSSLLMLPCGSLSRPLVAVWHPWAAASGPGAPLGACPMRGATVCGGLVHTVTGRPCRGRGRRRDDISKSEVTMNIPSTCPAAVEVTRATAT